MPELLARILAHHLDWAGLWRDEILLQNNPETARFDGGPSTPEEIAEFNGFVRCLKSIIERLPHPYYKIAREAEIVDLLTRIEVTQN